MTLDRDSMREQLRSADEHWGGLHPGAAPSEVAARLNDLRQERLRRRARRRAGLGVAGSLLVLAVAVGFWVSQGAGASRLAGRGHPQRPERTVPAIRESADPAESVIQLRRDLQLVHAELARLRLQQLALRREELGLAFARATDKRVLQQQLAESRAQHGAMAVVDQPIDFGF